MGTERFWKAVWLAAACHNFLGGLFALFLGDWLHVREGLPAPDPAAHFLKWCLLVMTFGVMYYLVYRDLYNTRNLVFAGILAKVLMAGSDTYFLATGAAIPKALWVGVGTNSAFVVLFVLFLRFVKKGPDPAARRT